MKAKILIIGGGGREHALAWKLSQSPKVEKIFIAPGNAGTAQIGENVNIAATNIDALAGFALENAIDLTVVGQDDPLALGIVDSFQSKNLKIWGPKMAAAQIEASKAFAKKLMQEEQIPTAAFETFSDYEKALTYVRKKGAPIVIKASGLALGKGVTVCQTLEEAEGALKAAMINKTFGDAGSTVVIEEFLQGREFSAHAFCDGKTFQMLPSAQDHKAVNNGGKGPNTGGMGTIAPVPWVTAELMGQVASNIVVPALKGLKDKACPFVGLLYPGLMQTADGPKVIEFNCRFGDPETQSYMRLLKTDLYDILTASAAGRLADIKIEWENKFACCVVAASGGYPGDYTKGKEITGLKEAAAQDDVIIFHAGTKMLQATVVTNGGRVLGVTAVADNLKTALDKAYAAIKLINFEGMHYRTDIGQKSLTS